MLSTREEVCRYAIYLNNTGTNLLVNGSYRRAHEVMKTAVYAIREVTSHDVPSPQATSRVQSNLLKASRYLASCSSHSTSHHKGETDNPHVCQQFTRISDDTALYNPAYLTDMMMNSGTHLCPVIISPVSSMGHESITDAYDLLSAKIVYNFGLTYLCLSRVAASNNSQDEQAAGKLRDGAIDLFGLSRTIIAKLHEDANVQDDDEMTVSLCLTSIVLLQALRQTLVECGRHADAEECDAKLRGLGEAVGLVDSYYSGMIKQNVAPAA